MVDLVFAVGLLSMFGAAILVLRAAASRSAKVIWDDSVARR